ncbi:MAG: hypothetical protein JZU58_09305 [Curvibacter lanceolatus]|uniref:hypothetical protein n=1 Tax=Curvibacter lanceolatus TaxID=86182 RepID=UPI00235593FA|nr:hypothetical protein [Curvibacter lanceolatus]MBV5292538.1 hypothetical protein [Curvibacter lanceolatus]
MIAANYRKHPEAMALQLVLPFSRLFRWHTSRPTTRLGRLFRALAAAAFKAKGYTQAVAKKAVPGWFSAAKAEARKLARSVKVACIALPFDELERLQRVYQANPPKNPYARMRMLMRLEQAKAR